MKKIKIILYVFIISNFLVYGKSERLDYYLAPKSDIATSKYDSPQKVAEYILMAFGQMLFGDSASENFYSTISELICNNTNNPNGKYLEIGSGVGRIVADLAKRFPASIVYGAEPSAEMVKWANTIVHNNLPFNFNNSNFHGLGLANTRFVDCYANQIIMEHGPESFDSVISVNVIDRLENPKKFLESLCTLVKKGGRLFLINAFDYEQTTPEDKRLFQNDVDAFLEKIGFIKIHYSKTQLMKIIDDNTTFYDETIAFYELRTDEFKEARLQDILTKKSS